MFTFQNMLGKMAASGGVIVSSINAIHRFGLHSNVFPGVLSQVRSYAARKGTREKAKKKKVKMEVKKLTYQQRVERMQKTNIIKPDALLSNEHTKPMATDDVYIGKYFQWRVYTFPAAIQCHREHFHPTMYNAPDSLVTINVELNMEGLTKAKKSVPAFSKIVPIKYEFDTGESRKILAFCKTEEQVTEALKAGAALAGGSDIIQLILSGEITLSNYHAVVAHPSMMPEVLTLRGLLKKKYPNARNDTLGLNVKSLIHTQLYGIHYTAKPYDLFPHYGVTEIPIGRLSMQDEKLEDNLKTAINSVMSAKPKRPGPFITRIRVMCPPSAEKFKIDHKLYVAEEPEIKKNVVDQEDDDEEEDAAVPVAI